MRTRLLFILILAVAALTAASCGGGGKSGASSTAPSGRQLTKAQYLHKIAQIETRLSAVLPAGSINPGNNDVATKAAAQLDKFVDELAKVNPPTEIRAVHAHFVAALRQFAKELPSLFAKLDKAKSASDAMATFFGAKSFQALAKVEQEFQAKGYVLPGATDTTGTTTTG